MEFPICYVMRIHGKIFKSPTKILTLEPCIFFDEQRLTNSCNDIDMVDMYV